MTRPELRAAWIMGFAIPLAETLRRRTDFSNPPAYIDDFIWGGLLLWSAFAIRRGRWYGNALLAASWGIFCGAMYYSFFGQIMDGHARDISGLPNAWVVVLKGLILSLSTVCLVLSIRRFHPVVSSSTNDVIK